MNLPTISKHIHFFNTYIFVSLIKLCINKILLKLTKNVLF